MLKYTGFVNLLIGVFVLLFFTYCKDNVAGPPQKTDIIFMGHKGGGSNSYNDQHIENTIGAVHDGLKSLDGVEMDIQMSLDSTIWIFHNVDINGSSCDTSFHNTIILLHDKEIEKIRICDDSMSDRIYRLSELIDLWKSTPGGFYISLEIKNNFTKDQFNQIGGEKAYVLKMANRLALLLNPLPHPNKLFIEVYNKDFCSKMKKLVPGIYICLIKWGSFQDIVTSALNGGFQGISCGYRQLNISAAEVKRAKDSGLVVVLWTPYYLNELKEAFDLHPTVIQTDNLTAKKGLNLY